MWFKIYAGIPDFDSGAPYQATMSFPNQREAEHYAWYLAQEEYESYGGMHGYYDRDAIYEDPEEFGVNPDSDTLDEDVEAAYKEQVEFAVEYYVVPASGPDDTEDPYY